MEASPPNLNGDDRTDAWPATSPYAKHTSLRGAAGYKAWKGTTPPPQSPNGGQASQAAESSTTWANRVRSQKNRGGTEEGRSRETGSRLGSRNGNRVEKGGGEYQSRRGATAWNPRLQNSTAVPAWERLSRPPSRVKAQKTPDEGEAAADSPPNRPPSRRKIEGRVVELGEEPETYDLQSRGFSRSGPAQGGRPAWNQGAAGAATRPAWTTGAQPRVSRPSSRLSSRQASREGSTVEDISYQRDISYQGDVSKQDVSFQLEDIPPSSESSRTDLVSISSHEGGEPEKPARGLSAKLTARGSARFSEGPGVLGNDENLEPGSRPPSESSSFQRSASGSRSSPPPSEQYTADLHTKKARISATKADAEDQSGARRSGGGAIRARVSAPRVSESPRLGGPFQRPESARDWSPIRKRKDDPLQPQTLAEYMATPRSPLRSPVCPPRPSSARVADIGMTPLNLDTPPAREPAPRFVPDADEDADDAATMTDVQQRISAARHNTTDLRPATTANVTRAGLLSAPPLGAVKEVDLSALADKLFQPREHMPRRTSATSATVQPLSAGLPLNGPPSRRQSARRDVTGSANQTLPAGGEGQGGREQGETEDTRKALRRPPSRQKPPPESLHLFTGETSGPATVGATLELEARPETTAGHMRVGVFQARAVQSEPINRLHKLFIRPPSRQRPPPEALCLGDIEAETAEKSFREIYSSSDCESP